MIEKVDLLVHIGASATRQDDNNYREQAKAYLEFKGDIGHYSEQIPRSSSNGVLPGPSIGHIISERGSIGPREDETKVFLDDTQMAYNALDSQLITSSFVMPSQVSIRSASQQSWHSQAITEHRNQIGAMKACMKNQHRAPEDAEPSLHQFVSQNADSADSEVHVPTPAQNAMSTPRAVPDTHPLSQSSYLKSPVLDRVGANKKRRLINDNAIQSLHSAPANYIPLPGPSGLGLAYIGDEAVESTELQAEDENGEGGDPDAGQHSYETTSELPTSYSLSDITSESSRARNRANASQRSASDPGPRGGNANQALQQMVSKPGSVEHHFSEVVLQPILGNKVIASNVAATAMSGHQNKSKATVTLSTKPDDVQPANNETSRDQTKPRIPWNGAEFIPGPQYKPRGTNHASDLGLDPSTLSEEICPPSPPVGLEAYTSHLTPSLIYFSTDSPVKDSYKPISVAREIRPLERGHWLLNPSTWTLQLQVEFWKFLERVIGQGSVGWAVWCCREEPVDAGDRNRGSLGIVKVYCWGEVVEHIYLLLYVASKSQVRKLGLVWIDSEEEVVVRMRKG